MTIHHLSPNTDWFRTPMAVSVAYREYFGERGARLPRPAWRGAFSRLVRGLADWVAGIRERQAVLDQLSAMSDRDLADIGLNRGQTHAVFDPEFLQEHEVAHRAADDPRTGCWRTWA